MFKYSFDNKRYHTLAFENKKRYGKKIMKAAIDGGFTCPNIDGTCGKGGCIFCCGGSGYFTDGNISITEQIKKEQERIYKKFNNNIIIIAYFQANTNTYASVDELRKKYDEALQCDGISGLSIATRADCLGDDIIKLLKEYNKKTNLTIELGLQTVNDKTAEIINRGYNFEVFKNNFLKLKNANIKTCIHIIDGLPGENFDDMIKTAYIAGNLYPDGMKIQLLHVIKNTKLAEMYAQGKFDVMTLDEYVKTVCRQLEYIPPEVTIERITGDGKSSELLAPLWSRNKKAVFAAIDKYMKENNIYQGYKIYINLKIKKRIAKRFALMIYIIVYYFISSFNFKILFCRYSLKNI